MELYRIVSLCLVACSLQVSAHPTEESNNANEEQSNPAFAVAGRSVAALKGLYHEAKTTLDKFESCGTVTHLRMAQLASLKMFDYQACVNATREVADYEEFLIDFYYYLKFVGTTFFDLFENVAECRHRSGFFNVLNCTVVSFQSSGTEFDDILAKAKDLIVEVETDTDNLVYYFKECFFGTAKEFLTEMHTMIHTNC